MSKLIIMCGIPGSGKSTWAKAHMSSVFDEYVSRDEIRFALVKEGESYFSREDEVFKTFCRRIDMGLRSEATVWADATHLNMKSRLKLLYNLKEKPDEIEIVWMNTDYETAIARNEQRAGTRSYVPPEIIKKMLYVMAPPEFKEDKFVYKTIYEITPDQEIVVRKEG